MKALCAVLILLAVGQPAFASGICTPAELHKRLSYGEEVLKMTGPQVNKSFLNDVISYVLDCYGGPRSERDQVRYLVNRLYLKYNSVGE